MYVGRKALWPMSLPLFGRCWWNDGLCPAYCQNCLAALGIRAAGDTQFYVFKMLFCVEQQERTCDILQSYKKDDVSKGVIVKYPSCSN